MAVNSDIYKKVLDNMGEHISDKPSMVTKAMRKQAQESAKQIGITEAEHGQAMIDLQAMVRGEYGI